MENDTEPNTRKIAHVEFEPLVWEILKAKGNSAGRSVHQQVKYLTIKQMQKEGLYPEKTWGEILGATCDKVIEKIEENNTKVRQLNSEEIQDGKS